MNEPITISEEARKAAKSHTESYDGTIEETNCLAEIIQETLNAATAPLLKRIEDLQQKLTTYEGKTNFCCECGGTKAL